VTVSPSFPRVKRTAPGYASVAVDAFLAQARSAYDSTYSQAELLTSSEIRTMSFPVERGGYSSRHVDAALERLETAFAQRERAIAIAAQGEATWLERASHESAVLTARFARKPKHRFTRMGALVQGYAVQDVDAFSERVSNFLENGGELSLAEVRSVTFRARRGGYDEVQVDAALDAVIALLLALGQS
jgi:DivIVA domain-containing protein